MTNYYLSGGGNGGGGEWCLLEVHSFIYLSIYFMQQTISKQKQSGQAI